MRRDQSYPRGVTRARTRATESGGPVEGMWQPRGRRGCRPARTPTRAHRWRAEARRVMTNQRGKYRNCRSALDARHAYGRQGPDSRTPLRRRLPGPGDARVFPGFPAPPADRTEGRPVTIVGTSRRSWTANVGTRAGVRECQRWHSKCAAGRCARGAARDREKPRHGQTQDQRATLFARYTFRQARSNRDNATVRWRSTLTAPSVRGANVGTRPELGPALALERSARQIPQLWECARCSPRLASKARGRIPEHPCDVVGFQTQECSLGFRPRAVPLGRR